MKRLKRALKFVNRTVIHFGFDVKRFFRSVGEIPSFFRDWTKYKRMTSQGSIPARIDEIFPILFEKYDTAGDARGAYFYQDIWAARKIFKRNPARHVDVGSSVRGFVSSLLTFRSVEVIDVRPLSSSLPELKFIQDDATQLRQFQDNSLESISTLHAMEHFGLGRYGDPVDPDAHIKFSQSLKRVLAPGGHLYLSVPVGRERVEFNAQRVFAPQTILNLFKELTLVSFSGVKDDGNFYSDATPTELSREHTGCGMFEFVKPT